MRRSTAACDLAESSPSMIYLPRLMNSNPIPGMLVANFTAEQKAAIQKALDSLVKERAGSTGAAPLSPPINIGIGTK